MHTPTESRAAWDHTKGAVKQQTHATKDTTQAEQEAKNPRCWPRETHAADFTEVDQSGSSPLTK